MATEKQKMLAGELYRADDSELAAERARCDRLLRRYNGHEDSGQRRAVLTELLGAVGTDVEIRSPFACDYGPHISFGTGAFMNFGGVILDCAPVTVGDGVQMGPSVQLLAADHPREADVRRAGLESAAPISLGANAWIGGGAIICAGVSIGTDSIIGAGSVVVRDVPAGVVAVGNPCRVLRSL
ncbi:sugar O-acetyltransferase [soil metagenome]